MTTATLERPAISRSVIEQASRVIQEHLDKEARNRRQSMLQPRELCPMQKAELVQDLASILR